MKYILQPLLLVLSSLIIVACGSTGTTAGFSSDVSVTSTKSTLTANKKIMNMNLVLTNNYSSKVNVQVEDLALNIAPCEVLSTTFVPNGFTFTKSSNVKVRAELTFAEECTPTSYKLEGTTLITLDGQTREMALNSTSQELNASIATDVPSGYEVSVTTKDNDFNMGIPNIEKSFSINVKDANGNLLNNDFKITKIEVLTENSLIVQLLDKETGQSTNSLLLKNENNSSFTLSSKKFSGIAPIRVNIDFIDTNRKLKNLSTLISIPVKSGPPSAISISYVSTGHDEARAKYEEKFAVSVTDEYGNRVNTKPYISLGAIVGYAVDGRESSSVESSQTRRLYYGQSDIQEGAIANGTVDPLGDEVANTTNFEDTTAARSNVFKWVNAEGANSDKLVVFGKGKNYEAMGKWDFSKLNNSTLTLEDDYFGEFRSNLSYAIGRNYYQDQCKDDSREWLGTTDSESYQLDDEGTVIVSYKYDYHLMGKDALVWVNLNGYQSDTQKNTRLGEVTKHTLLGQGLRALGGTASLDANETKSITYEIWHEAVPHVPYRNAHFGWRDLESNDCEVLDVQSSNEVDARTCDNGWSQEGRSYITLLLRSAEDKGCTFGIEDILVSNEF